MQTMNQGKKIYPSFFNPLFLKPNRSFPQKVAVIGAGTIGPDIGYYLKTSLPGIKLYLVDVAEEPLKKAENRLGGYVKKALDMKKMKEDRARMVLENIIYTQDYNQIRNCDLVIEAATERIPIKQQIFEKVESLVRPEAIITSNTSSIPADRIFNKMKRPQRTTITHFFAPAWRSLPVEVITWEGADQETVDFLCWFFAATGKVPIVTANALCFMLDRVFANWCNEAAGLLDQATTGQVDKAAEEFVFAGPFFVLNLSNGNPIIIETNTLQMEEGAHYRPAPILASVDRWLTNRPGAKIEVPEDKKPLIRDRLLGILFSQAFDIIDRGIGTREDLNFGCQIALGFRKGVLDIMQELGETEVARVMKKFEAERPGFPQAKQPLSFYLDFKRHLLVDEIEGVKVITLRRPQALNALNDLINDEILLVLKQYHEDPAVKGFVLTGYGNQAFSAGADIGKFPEMLGDRKASAQYARDCANVPLFMDRMKKPVVAAVNGLALGGGLELALRCHRLVATRKSTLQFPEITLGILPGIGGCVVPYRRWPQGVRLFHEMICLARPLSAQEALEVGMVSRVVGDYGDLIQAAVDEVKDLTGKVPRIPEGRVALPEITLPDPPLAGKSPLSPEAVAVTVRTIRAAAEAETLAEALEIGYQGFGEIACTEAAREGISAFLEKRRPEFKK
jgi:enoyl-CoA hydratase/3-hydroxyacyl-CoA dehydrogenase